MKEEQQEYVTEKAIFTEDQLVIKGISVMESWEIEATDKGMRRIAAEGKIPIEKVRPAIPEVLRSDGTSNWCDPVLSINAMIARPTKFKKNLALYSINKNTSHT